MDDLYSSEIMYRGILVTVVDIVMHSAPINQLGSFRAGPRFIIATSLFFHGRRFMG
jgi:hypothetical protein